jgi:hypothetical protein
VFAILRLSGVALTRRIPFAVSRRKQKQQEAPLMATCTTGSVALYSGKATLGHGFNLSSVVLA